MVCAREACAGIAGAGRDAADARARDAAQRPNKQTNNTTHLEKVLGAGAERLDHKRGRGDGRRADAHLVLRAESLDGVRRHARAVLVLPAQLHVAARRAVDEADVRGLDRKASGDRLHIRARRLGRGRDRRRLRRDGRDAHGRGRRRDLVIVGGCGWCGCVFWGGGGRETPGVSSTHPPPHTHTAARAAQKQHTHTTQHRPCSSTARRPSACWT